MRFQTTGLAIWLLAGLTTELFAGAGLYRDGVGPISSGRGGTNIAQSDNGASLFDNPATIINAPSHSFFEIGVDTVITDLDYSDPDPNSSNGEFRPMASPMISYFEKSEDESWAWGLGIFAPAGFTAEYNFFSPIFGTRSYRSMGGLAKFLPTLAVQVTDRLSVGGSLGVAFSRAEVEGPMFLQIGPMTAPALVNLHADSLIPTFSVGMTYKLTPRTVVGLSYSSEDRFRLDGELDVSVVGLAPIPVPATYELEMDLVWPRRLGAGIVHQLNDRQRLSADLVWYDWSSAFESIDLQLKNGNNPILNGAIGPSINVNNAVPLNWRDSVAVRLGHEYFLTRNDTLRAGYAYHRVPTPNNTLNPYIDGVLEHTLSAGYSRQFIHRGQQWGFNLAYQFSFGKERNVGTSIVPGGDFSNSEYKGQAHWVMVSLSREL